MLILNFFAMMVALSATEQQVLVDLKEYVNQEVIYNPLKAGSGIWYDQYENQSSYYLEGYLVVYNMNPNGKTISDIYVNLGNTTDITLPFNINGRNGTFLLNNTSTGNIVLHIPELNSGENSTWFYTINNSAVRPPLNFTTSYSDSKLLAGDNILVTDLIENVFDNASFQTNTCFYDINITQVTVPVDFAGIPQDFYFLPLTLGGVDSGNVTFAADNKTQYWNTLSGTCLNKGESTSVFYNISTPLNIPKTTHYAMINTSLEYKSNNTFSHLKVDEIIAISEGRLEFEKKIMYPAHPVLYGSNVTWNVTAYFSTDTNITYNLSETTMWVAKRTGIMGNPNTVDNDTISNASLEVVYNPYVLVNKTLPWTSSSWLFNYSDVPSPIVWMDVNFSIQNDGVQLVDRSIIQNGNDIYVKELYLIIGYWLEIEKNITAISANEYNVKIDVHNKGNQVTPSGTVVTIYDFVPTNFNITSPFIYDVTTAWYNTAHANFSIAGEYNGSLHQWGLIPSNVLNTSFAQGPMYNANTTWSVEFNVTGMGDYTLMDVFVTGLDPQRVDGAGSSSAVVVSEVLEKIKSTEGIFAAVASVLLLLGLLL